MLSRRSLLLFCSVIMAAPPRVLQAHETTGAPLQQQFALNSMDLSIIAISLVCLVGVIILTGLSISLRKLNQRLQQEAQERRLVEQQLETDRNYLRILFEHNGSGHLVVSSTRAILKVNRQFCEMFGYGEDELLGQSVRMLHLDEQHYQDWAPRFLEVRDSLTRMSAEYPSLRKDGSIIWCLFTGVSLNLPSGEPGVVWSLIDISDRKRAEEELRLSEQKYASIFNLMPDMIGITRCSDGCFIEVNPGFERCTGWSREEVLGQSSLTLGLWDHATRAKAIGIVKKQGHLEEFEFILTTKMGIQRHALMYLIPITIEGVECLCFLARDIHDKRIAERALQRFSLVVEQTANIVLITDPEGTIQYVNPRFSEVTGYSRQEVIGLSPRLLKSGHQSREFYDELWQTITSGRPWRGEFCNRAKDGSEFWELATVTPLFDDDGAIINFVAIKEVITDRKQAEAALHEAKDRAEAANRAKSEFLANMSHEIRTPMNGVIGMVHLLRTTELSLEQRLYLTNIEISATSLTTLLSDILDLSRIEAGKMSLEQTDFSLRQCIRELLDSQLYQVREKGLLVSTNLAPELPEIVRGDQLRTRQILLNLVGNAIKFTEQGRIEITARVILRDKAKLLVRLDVADSGIGMPAEQMERIFAPFEQADNSTTRRYGGSGLGLAICRRLAALMGGSIWAESVPDSGSTFHLELPFVVPDPTATIGSRPADEDSQPSVSPLTLLLAEDNRVNAEFIFKILTKLGHRVTTCENGQQALDFLQTGQRFDALLMDIQMPVMGGDEAVRLIRQQEEEQGLRRHIPIIALTAHAMDDERQRLLAQGFDAHVAKPVEIGILMAELARLTHAPGHGQNSHARGRA